jgi:hypothetical protein
MMEDRKRIEKARDRHSPSSIFNPLRALSASAVTFSSNAREEKNPSRDEKNIDSLFPHLYICAHKKGGDAPWLLRSHPRSRLRRRPRRRPRRSNPPLLRVERVAPSFPPDTYLVKPKSPLTVLGLGSKNHRPRNTKKPSTPRRKVSFFVTDHLSFVLGIALPSLFPQAKITPGIFSK